MRSETCQVEFYLLSHKPALNVTGSFRVRGHQSQCSRQNGLDAGEALFLVSLGKRFHGTLLGEIRRQPRSYLAIVRGFPVAGANARPALEAQRGTAYRAPLADYFL
jgi:hypothetical protein